MKIIIIIKIVLFVNNNNNNDNYDNTIVNCNNNHDNNNSNDDNYVDNDNNNSDNNNDDIIDNDNDDNYVDNGNNNKYTIIDFLNLNLRSYIFFRIYFYLGFLHYWTCFNCFQILKKPCIIYTVKTYVIRIIELNQNNNNSFLNIQYRIDSLKL